MSSKDGINKWKCGDIHPTTGKIFWQTNGKGYDEFISPEKFKERKERNRRITNDLYAKDPEKRRAYSRKYHWLNRDRRIQAEKQWVKNNPEKKRALRRACYKNKKENDPLFKLKDRVRKSIMKAFKRIGCRKNSKTIQILGCSIEFFRGYIEAKFTEGMNWKNYGSPNETSPRAWVLDHVIPISSSKTPEDVHRLSHYTNYQPLWDKDNSEKSDLMPDEYELMKAIKAGLCPVEPMPMAQ